MSFQRYTVTVTPFRFHLAISLLSVTLLLTLFNGPARGAGSCTCKDLDKIREQLDRAAASEEAWKEIFAWARELLSRHRSPEIQ